MKKITSLALALSLVVLGACGSSQEKEAPVEDPTKVEVSVGKQLIGTAYFDFNVYNKVASASYDSLKTIVEQLSEATGVITILVHGHTDHVGSQEYNQKLSVKRANFIKSELVKNGVPADQIVIKGFNFSQPIEMEEDEDPKTGSTKNRRAEVFFDVRAEGEDVTSDVEE